jgi:hypothetical protein
MDQMKITCVSIKDKCDTAARAAFCYLEEHQVRKAGFALVAFFGDAAFE